MPKNKKHWIYFLTDPQDGAVRYVGKSKNPRARFKTHVKESLERQNTLKKQWIKGLLDNGLQPVLKIVDSRDTEAEGRLLESRYCTEHVDTVYNIYNPRRDILYLRPDGKKGKPKR